MTRLLLKFVSVILGSGLFFSLQIPLVSEPTHLFHRSLTSTSRQNKPLSATRPTKAISALSDDIATQTPRLVVELSRRQVALYRGSIRIKSYPIAVGRQGWETPTGSFRVKDMQQNPVWINPFTDKAVSAEDPKNPLGDHWIGFWTDGHNWIGFHGTPDSQSVGKAASHGCIRMHNQDIEELFYQISPGTPVLVKG